MLITKEILDMHLIKELDSLLKEAKEEVYSNKDNVNLYDEIKKSDPDYQHYLFLQRKGLFQICCLRNDKKELVGFHSSSFFYHTQAKKVKCAYVDTCFVKKQYRGVSSVRLMNFAELQIKKNHVKYIYWGVNPKLNTHKLLEKMNWKLDEVVYTKEI